MACNRFEIAGLKRDNDSCFSCREAPGAAKLAISCCRQGMKCVMCQQILSAVYGSALCRTGRVGCVAQYFLTIARVQLPQ